MDLAYELNRIFNGNVRGHGEYRITSTKGDKLVGSAKTVKGTVNEDIWRKHLSGEVGLGVVPITEDNTCTWGSVDVDVYDGLDIEELSLKITTPIVLCRSKSGGLHVMLFTTVPVPATLMRKKLGLVARAIGHPNAEIFPKQDKLINPEDIGNWINMPYFNCESTTRYCIKGGMILNTQEFIELITERSMNAMQLVAYQPESIVEGLDDPEFDDAPPCIRYLTKNGFPTGSKNIALFSMGVYARKKFATGWEDMVDSYNKRFMSGTYSEVAGIIRSLQSKNYTYKCKEQPLLAHCNKDECHQCQFGVTLSTSDERSKRKNVLQDVIGVTLYDTAIGSKDDPYYVFRFSDKEMDVTIDMTLSQTLFRREYARIFKKGFLPIKDQKWMDSMNSLTDNELNKELVIKQLAPDAGPEGRMWIHLSEFCTGKSRARVRDEMLLGKPWHDEDRTYFRSTDFMKYLDQQRFRELESSEIVQALKTRGSKHHHFNLKGKHVTCWSIPSFDSQTEGFDPIEVHLDDEY